MISFPIRVVAKAANDEDTDFNRYRGARRRRMHAVRYRDHCRADEHPFANYHMGNAAAGRADPRIAVTMTDAAEAYSAEPDEPIVEPPRRSWPATICRALGALLFSAGAAGVIVTGWNVYERAPTPPPMVVPSGPASPPPVDVPAPPIVMPPNITHKADADTVFLAGVANNVTGFEVDTPAEVIPVGRAQCDSLAAGRSIGDVAAALRARYTAISVEDSYAFVRAAARAYCPQYETGQW